MPTDPICGMTVDSRKAIELKKDGLFYYFCSRHCKEKFLKGNHQLTQTHLTPSISPMSDEVTSLYTCPMHPEIEEHHPGDCPKCGMALERKSLVMNEDFNEVQSLFWKFWVSLILKAALSSTGFSPWVNG